MRSLFNDDGMIPSVRKQVRRVFFLVIIAAGTQLYAGESSSVSSPRDQQSVSVTVYNDNLGLIKDVRKLDMPKGIFSLAFEGVASGIDPTSVSIRSLDDPGALNILEQNFEYDLISPKKLMEKYLGKEIELVSKTTDGLKTDRARLIGTEGGYVYEIEGKIAINPAGKVVLPRLPEGLISKPSLIWLLDNRVRKQMIEASYLTKGISWRTDYVMVLSENDSQMDMSGWITVANRSGATYKNAILKLVAGDVHRVQPEQPARRPPETLGFEMSRGPIVRESALFEYHMYSVARKTTLKNNQTKQIRMLDAAGVPVSKQYVYTPTRPYFFSTMVNPDISKKVGVFLKFMNEKKNGLGMPLPKGVVRVYKKDDDGSLEFLGEDRIDHTPEDEKLRIKIGEAFDIVAERIQTEFRKFKNSFESAYKITIRNHKKQDIVVSVIERLGGDWKIEQQSHEYTKESASRVRFDVPVKSKGESILTYRVAVKR